MNKQTLADVSQESAAMSNEVTDLEKLAELEAKLIAGNLNYEEQAAVTGSLKERLLDFYRSPAFKEMVKNDTRYRWLCEPNEDWHVEQWVHERRGEHGTWKVIHGAKLDTTIDAARLRRVDRGD